MPCHPRRWCLAAPLLALLPGLVAWAEPVLSVDALLAEAAQARGTGDMVRAAALYKQVLDHEPGHRLAAYNAGIILENAGRPDLAVGVWRGALAADPGDLFAFEHLVRNLARAGGLPEVLASLESQVAGNGAPPVPRLQHALALAAAGREGDAVAALESFLLEEPASNIAYNFLKDVFVSTADFTAYVQGVDERARREGAPESLQLLAVRLLLERGRGAAAVAFARGEVWQEETSLRLLRQAGVLSAARPDSGGPATAAKGSAATEGPVLAEAEESGDSQPAAGDEAAPPAEPLPVPILPEREETAEELPDFGPQDPRSASRYEQEGRAALTSRDNILALEKLRRSVEAAPLRLQPRILLALLLEQGAHPGAARAVLRGPVEPSPWDVYQQGWRAVRDDHIDADYGGVDIFRLRTEARRRIRTLDEAKIELGGLLAGLDDGYAHLFDPERFAGYLLTPNAGAGAPRLKTAWIPVPRFDEGGLTPLSRTPPTQASPPASPAPDPESGAADPGGRMPGREQMPERVPALRRPLQVRPQAPAAAAGTEPEQESVTVAASQAPVWPRDPGPTTRWLPGRVGYLAIPSLAALDLPERIDLALVELSGSRHLVIDLRGNRGGDGEVAIEVASLFLAPGTEVCTYETRRGREVRRSLGGSPFLPAKHMAVLTDELTASAAELLAAALKETTGALLVGEQTAGKGVGQRALLLPDGSGMSFTRFRLLAPSGASWHGRGLNPDLALATESPMLLDPDQPDGALEAALTLLRAR